MASIQQRKGKTGDRWRVIFRINGNQVSDTFLDATGAAEYAALVDRIGGAAAREILRQRRGSPSGGRVPTVAQATQDHIDALSGITIGTRRDYEKIAKRFAESSLGPLPVDSLTREAVTAWVNAQTVSAKTIRNRHSLLYAAMERQVELGNIPANPCRNVRIGRSERQEMVILTPAELDLILDRLRPHWHPLVKLLAGTGLRFGEATALQVHDVDLAASPPRIRVARAWKHTDGGAPELGAPKTGRGRRVVSLAPDLADVLHPLVTERNPSAFVITNTAGRHVRQNSFHEIWSAALDDAADAGLSKRPRIHDLRHTHASWLISRGVPLPIIQRRLGHESITTTVDTYGHLADDAMVVAAEASYLTPSLPEIEAGVIDGELVDG